KGGSFFSASFGSGFGFFSCLCILARFGSSTPVVFDFCFFGSETPCFLSVEPTTAATSRSAPEFRGGVDAALLALGIDVEIGGGPVCVGEPPAVITLALGTDEPELS